MVGAKGGHQPPAFHQHHAYERCDLARVHVIRSRSVNLESVVNIAHHNRLAAPIRIPQRRPECAHRAQSGKWCNTAHILAANGVHAIFDFRVADTVHSQTLAEQPRRDFLHVERIADRPERIGELEQEGISLFTRPPRLLAVRGVDEHSDEADEVFVRVEFWRRLAEDPSDAAVGQSTAEVGLPRRPGVQRRLDLERNRLAVVGVDRTFPAELLWLLRRRARSGSVTRSLI